LNLEIRKGRRDDCDFIAKVMVMSEGTGNEVTSYQMMFDMTPEELEPILAKALDNETEGHSLTYKSYLIATVDGVRAAALCAYIEGLNGKSNGMVMSRLMSTFSRADIKKAFKFLGQHRDVLYDKEPGILHMDTGATMPEFTGQGIYSKIFNYSEELHANMGIDRCHLQVWKKNKRALGLYLSRGYKNIEEKISGADPENGKILLEKVILSKEQRAIRERVLRQREAKKEAEKEWLR